MPFRETLLQSAATLPFKRLARISVQGRTYFVKMAEIHDSLRLRLFKGDPAKALAREAQLLRNFAARGAEVAQIVAADEQRLILADHGPTVDRLVRNGDADEALLHEIGAGLARLHDLGLAHGRPVLRDICWDGTRLTFLDLESGAREQATDHDKARDLFLLLHSVFVAGGAHTEVAASILQGYRAAGADTVWQATKNRSRRLWWMQILALPGVWLHGLRGKTRSEFAAIAPTRALIEAA